MIKEIIFSDGTTREMNFEEVREQFTPMVIRAMRKANNKFVYNQVEEDDFRQELEIELWRGFEAYDPSTGYCFTTYLHYKLMKGVRNATFYKYSKKNQHNGLLSMNATHGDDDLKLEDMFSIDDSSMDGLNTYELLDIIHKNTKQEEQEMLKILFDRENNTIQDYATKYGISRQAANQRLVRFRNKLRKVVKKQYLEIV